MYFNPHFTISAMGLRLWEQRVAVLKCGESQEGLFAWQGGGWPTSQCQPSPLHCTVRVSERTSLPCMLPCLLE